MAFELDHVFICAAAGAPEAASLIAFGLTEGTPNTHPGQGTANRRFFYFYFDFNQRPDARHWADRQPLAHPTGLGEITRVELVSPHASAISPELRAMTDTNLLRLRVGEAYLLELGFDGEPRREKLDLQPAPRFILSW